MNQQPQIQQHADTTALLSSRILIVDDVQTSRMILESFCKNAGLNNIKHAENGRAALDVIAVWKPDVILLDVEMPVMNGLSLCKTLKELGLMDDIIVIMQTGTERIELRAQAFEAGVTDLLSKPLHARECIARIMAHLERRQLKHQREADYHRLQQELREATIMQNILLPDESLLDTIRTNHTIDIAYYYHPASELAGDYLSVRILPNNHIALAMVDIAGHGVTAALYGFATHAITEDILRNTHTPADALSLINTKLHAIMTTGKFATVFLAIIDTDAKILHYAAAASPAPIFISQGTPSLLPTKGTPLGIDPTSHYTTHTLPYHTGDMLFLYSDALIETPNAQGNCMTQADIISTLQSLMNEPAGAYLNAIVMSLYGDYSSKPTDDVSMLVCKL